MKCPAGLLEEFQKFNYDEIKPYAGGTSAGVGRSTLTGKVMCGYQGWFNMPGDGADVGAFHYSLVPVSASVTAGPSIDMWPDTSELDPDEKYEVQLSPDGAKYCLYSNYNRKTTVRHFKWMQENEIDGAWIQRFVSDMRDQKYYRSRNVVLSHAREGCNKYGRVFGVMYDLSPGGDQWVDVLIEDWKRLVDQGRITEDKSYIYHNGRPVVGIWGVGIHKLITPEDADKLIRFFKNNDKYSCSILAGGPYFWRYFEGMGDALPGYARWYKSVDIISPWAAGRFRTVKQVETEVTAHWADDLMRATKLGKEYMPVIYPGFSWHNMQKFVRGKNVAFDEVPRRDGMFLWRQFYAITQIGAKMAYVGMFDEMDEGTAIFKVSSEPPSELQFLTYKPHPGDYYLRLTGAGGKMLKKKIPLTKEIPELYEGKIVDLQKKAN